MNFHGAKAALFIGRQLLVYLRDDRPDIPWPGHWDFPGGGREGDETPIETLRREVDEEFGLIIPDAAIRWKRLFPAQQLADTQVWFFVVTLPVGAKRNIVFGEEGQAWRLMPWHDFATLPKVVPSFAPRMEIWTRETGGIASFGADPFLTKAQDMRD